MAHACKARRRGGDACWRRMPDSQIDTQVLRTGSLAAALGPRPTLTLVWVARVIVLNSCKSSKQGCALPPFLCACPSPFPATLAARLARSIRWFCCALLRNRLIDAAAMATRCRTPVRPPAPRRVFDGSEAVAQLQGEYGRLTVRAAAAAAKHVIVLSTMAEIWPYRPDGICPPVRLRDQRLARMSNEYTSFSSPRLSSRSRRP